jgi:hypothetical protein
VSAHTDADVSGPDAPVVTEATVLAGSQPGHVVLFRLGRVHYRGCELGEVAEADAGSGDAQGSDAADASQKIPTVKGCG